MTAPLVSVGLPTYNRPLFLKRALNSLKNQSYTNFEVIVSDDCYPAEENRIVCDEFLKRGLNIIYHKPEKNLGAPNNHKRVLELAKGKYFFWASDDDLWDNHFISKGVLELEKNSKVVGWSPSFVNINNSEDIIRTYPSLKRFSSGPFKIWDLTKFLLDPESLGKCILAHGIYRTKELKEYVKVYFWNRGFPWMDNTFLYGLLSRMNITCSEEILFYKGLVDSQSTEIYRMSWRNYTGPVCDGGYLFYIKEHMVAAKNIPYALWAVLVLSFRFFVIHGFRIINKIKSL